MLSSKKALTYSEDCTDNPIKIYALVSFPAIGLFFSQCFPLIGSRKNPRNVRFINGFRNKQDHRRLSEQLLVPYAGIRQLEQALWRGFQSHWRLSELWMFLHSKALQKFKNHWSSFKNTDLIFKVLQKQYFSRDTIPLNAH